MCLVYVCVCVCVTHICALKSVGLSPLAKPAADDECTAASPFFLVSNDFVWVTCGSRIWRYDLFNLVRMSVCVCVCVVCCVCMLLSMCVRVKVVCVRSVCLCCILIDFELISQVACARSLRRLERRRVARGGVPTLQYRGRPRGVADAVCSRIHSSSLHSRVHSRAIVYYPRFREILHK